MGRNEFANIREKGRGAPLVGGRVGMGDLEKQTWERGKTAFTEKDTPKTPRLPERADDPEIAGLAAAVRTGVQQVMVQQPLPTEDQPASTLIWNVYDNVGWNTVLAAPLIQRVDSVDKNRLFFWCYSMGVPVSIIWLAPGQGVQAAFGALPGMGIPLAAPSAVGVFDGAAWSCQIGDDIKFYVSAGGAGARLVVVEGVRT